MDRPLDALPEGTKLAGYVIGRVLGRGSFGLVYRASDDLFPDEEFAIKEFLPVGIALRKPGAHSVHPSSAGNAAPFQEALAKFRQEALTLRELKHPNVVGVQRYIEQNGTAYVVMKYEHGQSLAQVLETGPLSEEEIAELLPPLLDGLEAIHAKGFLHRDLKPLNIYLRTDGTPVLLDFGAAREATGDNREASLTEIVTPGYAPFEQYSRHSAQGPYTDIYALGATLYRCMTGRPPPESIGRHGALHRGAADPLDPIDAVAPGRFSPALVAGVHRALALEERKRPQTIAELRALLSALRGVRKSGVTPSRFTSPPRTGAAAGARAARASSRRWMLVPLLAVVAAGIAFAVYRSWAPDSPAGREDRTATAGALVPGRAFRDCAQCPEMIVLPAGSFLMGSVAGEEVAKEDESPQRRIAIAKPFAIGKYEVTFAEWGACVAAKGCEAIADDNGWGRGQRPVMNLSSETAKRYAAWLSRTTGKTYRLPSEAEWEYAARAGAATRYAWGDEIGRNRANCESCGSQWDGKQTAPVGSFPANRFGLHDMHGNVWELVEDCRNESYRGAPADARPWLSGNCGRRMMRGGSWNNYHDAIRSAQRESLGTNDTSYDVGIRLVRVID